MELVMRVCCIGEGMLELCRKGDGWALGYGGDTLNTAIHLARFGHQVSFVTALGSDPFSQDLQRAWRQEGVDTSLIAIDPTRQAGLYAIRTDSDGERSFFYWRENSAARHLFDQPGIAAILEQILAYDLVYFSLITLAILPPPARLALLALCRQVRGRGGRIAFDGNYRPRLWGSAAEALTARRQALEQCDFGLPTLSDEILVAGDQTAPQVAQSWHRDGAQEVVVKMGPLGCLLPDGQVLPPLGAVVPVDSSGAGDSFNAGYLHGRLHGGDARQAAAVGHRLARWVLSRPGAIPARDDQADYSGAL